MLGKAEFGRFVAPNMTTIQQITRWLTSTLLLIACQKSIAQTDSTARSVQLFGEVSSVLTTGRAVPFWQRANQFGTVPLEGSVGTLRLGLSSDYRPLPAKRVDWGYGLEIVGNAGPTGGQLIIPQAYIKGRWRQLELYVGRRRTIMGLVDTLLTTGAYAVSGNALPLPTIQIGTRGYAPLRFTKGLISINATFGHAWFESADRKVSNAMLHQATFYARLGKPSWKVRLYAGVNHQVVWGGYSPYLGPDLANKGYLPSSLKAYFYAVTALAYPDAAVDGNVTSFDETNRIGNHLGSVDVGAEVDIGNTTIFLYRQNPYDSGAIWYLTTIADGLNGLSIRRKNRGSSFFSIDRGLVEYLYTGDQGGNQFVIDDPQRRGKVNYFNNAQYIDGWTTRSRVIGTPFLTPVSELYAWHPTGIIGNNRVSVLHLGLSGYIGKEASWLLKLSGSQNAGIYDDSFPKLRNQFSALVQLATPLRLPVLGTVQVKGSAALDRGDLLPDAAGFYVSLRKSYSSFRVK